MTAQPTNGRGEDSREIVSIGLASLSVAELVAVARDGARLELERDPAYRARLEAGRRALETALRKGVPVYGVTTGVGASQATLDKQQEDLVRRMQVFKQYRDRGLQPPDDEATLKRDLAALQDLYRQLQKRLTDEEARRAAPIRARLEETLTQLKAQRHIEKVSIVSPAPADDARTIDLTADLIRAADAQAPLP